jgi:Tat protein secretion system quality control protein TatD with DNase activity
MRPIYLQRPIAGSDVSRALPRITAEAIARQRKLSIDELAKMTEEVVENFFRFPPDPN